MMLRKTKQVANIIEAYNLGWRVREDGSLISPEGMLRRPYAHTRRKNSTYMRFKFGRGKDLSLHQLIGYQKFGEAALSIGTQVRHLDNNSLNNLPKNIGIGSPSDQAFDHPKSVRVARATHAASFRRKMSDGDVLEARRLHAEGMSGNALAKKFNVRKSTMSYIINGRTYRGVK